MEDDAGSRAEGEESGERGRQDDEAGDVEGLEGELGVQRLGGYG